ncbi:decaprenyl-diphosphate synthase subunit 2 [Lingula anatina]|uniref:Decaprenyl-diphosphate synthase subunit 2 n=1 Tax=Lingula anatina TaxID=7574 RepID=A0A1S3HV41_LINAN|nr:decaprenyl-diphosphate synthase subunit 2 [Lingula anatina]|eukprot:XP_013389910.1 decaprenyl-diphosphate synthase subunit 2 [Lingula anatina]
MSAFTIARFMANKSGTIQGLLKSPAVPLTLCRRCLALWGFNKPDEWKKTVMDAEKLVGYSTSLLSLRCIFSDELANVAMQVGKLVGTKHPLLHTARTFIWDDKQGPQTRGLIILLLSKAAGPSNHPDKMPDFDREMVCGIYQSQRNLAEIAEMIYAANLIHKGVVNLAEVKPADGMMKDMEFGNKMSVLSGDFFLANASTALADLENTKVVEIIASAIGDLMQAEFTGLTDKSGCPVLKTTTTMDNWYEQTFLSAGSLVAKSCKAAMELAKHSQDVQEKAFNFGKYLTFARQLNEDLQPYISEDGGSAPFNPTSAPSVLYAMGGDQDRVDFLNNCAKTTSGKMQALKLISKSKALEETKRLCREHGQKAVEAIKDFPISDTRTVLQKMAQVTTNV